MKLLKQAMAVLGTVVVIAMIVALVTPKTAHAIVATAVYVMNTPNVNVVNTPLPTQVTNTPLPVSANINFPASMNVSGSSVLVDNVVGRDSNNNPAPQPLVTRDTNNPAYEPMSPVYLCNSAGEGATGCEASNGQGSGYTVPAKTPDFFPVTRLVVEFAGGYCDVTNVQPSLSVLNQGNSYDHLFLVPSIVSNVTYYGQPVRLYLSPGQSVYIAPRFLPQQYFCDATLQGYFVVTPMPAIP